MVEPGFIVEEPEGGAKRYVHLPQAAHVEVQDGHLIVTEGLNNVLAVFVPGTWQRVYRNGEALRETLNGKVVGPFVVLTEAKDA